MMVTLIMKNLPLLQQPIQVLISLNSFKSYIKFQQMRNRQVIQFLICPRYFLSLTIPYKGKYFVRTRLYQKKLLNNKITYAYPTMRQFKDIKCIKHFQQASSQVTEQDVFYDTQTFFLYYSNEKIPLNSYCTFKLEYDEMREFKTYLQFQLIRKFDSTIVEQGCMVGDKGKCQDQIVCKEVYHINSYKRVDIFQRVYFYHHEFYCALDMYIATVNMGYAQRLYKFQLVQYSLQLKTSNKQKPQATKSKSYPSLTNEIYSINNQVTQYTELRKSMLKYQQSAKVKKSFLFQSISTTIQEKYQDLSYLKYTSKQFEYMPIQETFEQLKEDKRIINDNIRYLFQRLPFLIRDISLATFKVLITQSLKRKSDLKKKYLIKKVLYNNPEQSIQNMTPRMSFGQKTEFVSAELLRNTYTFKQTRKSEKQEFIHVRRQQFVKAFQIINFKDCSFPMMLIEKGSQNFLEKNGCLKGFENIIKGKMQAKDVDQLIQEDFSLIVLVHGFQGSHHDLRKLKNFLQFLNPHFKILPINSIEKDTSQNIQFLGQKIAAQIQFYIANSYEKIKQISFIGFSLGGVLIRASLKYLSKYKDLMQLLITLASPHLGVSQSENALVNFGIWYLSKVEKAKNIKELNFQSVTEKDSFLMKLSQDEEIGWFKKVVIVSSSEDQFVPHYSARIIGNTKNSQINQMAKNIMSKIKNYQRMQVWFDVEKKSSLDKLIGRKSHIEFIENFAFLQMLCQIYQKEF